MQTILGGHADFERMSGHKLMIEYGSTPRMKARVETGAADLTINERYVLDDLAQAGPRRRRHARRCRALPVCDRRSRRRAQARCQFARCLEARAAGGRKHRPARCRGRRAGRRLLRQPHRANWASPTSSSRRSSSHRAATTRRSSSPPAAPRWAWRSGAISCRWPGSRCWNRCPTFPAFKFLMVAGLVTGARERDGALAFANYLASPAVAPVIKANGHGALSRRGAGSLFRIEAPGIARRMG